jgi:hypothetical protein
LLHLSQKLGAIDDSGLGGNVLHCRRCLRRRLRPGSGALPSGGSAALLASASTASSSPPPARRRRRGLHRQQLRRRLGRRLGAQPHRGREALVEDDGQRQLGADAQARAGVVQRGGQQLALQVVHHGGARLEAAPQRRELRVEALQQLLWLVEGLRVWRFGGG